MDDGSEGCNVGWISGDRVGSTTTEGSAERSIEGFVEGNTDENKVDGVTGVTGIDGETVGNEVDCDTDGESAGNEVDNDAVGEIVGNEVNSDSVGDVVAPNVGGVAEPVQNV